MSGIVAWVGQYWLSGILVLGVIVAIWYVAWHREKLLLNKATPPKE